MPIFVALILDLIAVTVFAAIGRASHAEGLTLLGLAATAWPFLVGCLIGHLIARVARLTFWRTGVAAWVSTVVVGMILRVLTGAGTQLSFVIVATVTVAMFFFGWRLIPHFRGRARR